MTDNPRSMSPAMIDHISVIIVTKNEARHIKRCLAALSKSFADIYVVDSQSTDGTLDIARGYGAKCMSYQWDDRYPKKRGWCLENIKTLQDWVLFVDADEIVTEDLAEALAYIPLSGAGYFIESRYALSGKVLRFGARNKKLCLLNRHKMSFPAIDDLDIAGMGEIEGHYQPVRRSYFAREAIGTIYGAYMLHYAFEDETAWRTRHERYAQWEAQMSVRNLWPRDPVLYRQILKRIFRALPFRGTAAFLHSYVLTFGILDGMDGLRFARARGWYYRRIAQEIRAIKKVKKV
ncbi:MAG: glycosyltransferase family 2 protein [Alphaproteobacteria bacterium]